MKSSILDFTQITDLVADQNGGTVAIKINTEKEEKSVCCDAEVKEVSFGILCSKCHAVTKVKDN